MSKKDDSWKNVILEFVGGNHEDPISPGEGHYICNLCGHPIGFPKATVEIAKRSGREYRFVHSECHAHQHGIPHEKTPPKPHPRN